jgi:Protein of unknown function (DUF3105)
VARLTATSLMHSAEHETPGPRGLRPDASWLSYRLALALLGFALVALAGVTPIVLQNSPRGLVRSLPLPGWLESVMQQDALVFRGHAAIGTALNALHVQPVASASEWFKAAHHAHSDAEIEEIARGLSAAATRTTPEALEAILCPFVSEWSDAIGWGARGRQLNALSRADLSCGDYSTVYGTVPNDVQIAYPSTPPTSGLYHEAWYPTYGVASEIVPPAEWVHNLAHGEIVLLFYSPEGCADVLAQAAQLQAELPPGRNPRGAGARLIITSYDQLSTPLAVIAWGVLLPLDHFDWDRIAVFYGDHVDRGVECRNLHC